MQNLEKFAKPTVRIAMSLVFITIGLIQLFHLVEWSGFVPSFALVFGLTAITVVKINAIMEISLGTLMLLGLYTRVSAFILAAHLFVISFSLGLNDLAVRDYGLAFATLSVFFAGQDQLCLDTKFSKNEIIKESPQTLNMPIN